MNRVEFVCLFFDRFSRKYLYTTCEIPEDTPIEPDDFLGVDLGEVNIAVDSTGKIFSNDKVEKARLKYQKQRSHCQKKQTKSSNRKLKKVSGKERRFRTDTNHCVSKYLVEKAKDTNVGIALEDFKWYYQKMTFTTRDATYFLGLPRFLHRLSFLVLEI